MTINTVLKGAAALLLASPFAAPAHAQDVLLSSDPMVQARAAEARHDPVEALSRYLRALSASPNDLEALTGAGRAALDIGDPRAAVGFYARAEEIAPRNGRVKAGLGSAMVQMENAKAALKLFDEAVDLGVPPHEVASDRGLAYDLKGDNRRAQQEYVLALKTRDDPETVRRLALSLAISGDRAGALAVLDPLLRRQDIPAWRVRAFVLALVGDAAGAETAALAVMPRPQAAALLPFLARLKELKPAQQAAAVNFGHFPSDGRHVGEAQMLADSVPPPKPSVPGVGAGLIPSGTPLGRGGSATAPNEQVSLAPRRRPGAPEDRMASVAAILGLPPPVRPPAMIAPPAPASPLKLAEAGSVRREKVKETRAAKDGKSGDATSKDAPVADAPGKGRNGKAKATDGADAKETKGKDARSRDSGKEKEAAKDKRDKDSAKDKIKEAKGSERYWAQVAGGANKADLPKAYARLKEKSPKLLAGRAAWTTPLRATNRLLVGPFKTLEEAQEFVNRANKESLSAFAYTSPAGQNVEMLGAK
jgi:Flp pilus assembly protein TadD